MAVNVDFQFCFQFYTHKFKSQHRTFLKRRYVQTLQKGYTYVRVRWAKTQADRIQSNRTIARTRCCEQPDRLV